jgi:mRNA interferase MazF
MRQKEIWMVDFNPVVGSEQSGIRPAVIVSGNTMNNIYKVGFVCPLSSKIKAFKGCPVIIAGGTNKLNLDSQVLSFQIRTISILRLLNKIGEITDEQLDEIHHGINLYLHY